MLRFILKISLIFIWFLNGLNLYSEEVVVELKNGASVSGELCKKIQNTCFWIWALIS